MTVLTVSGGDTCYGSIRLNERWRCSFIRTNCQNWCQVSNIILSIQTFRSRCGKMSYSETTATTGLLVKLRASTLSFIASLQKAVSTPSMAFKRQLWMMRVPCHVGSFHRRLYTSSFPRSRRSKGWIRCWTILNWQSCLVQHFPGCEGASWVRMM